MRISEEQRAALLDVSARERSLELVERMHALGIVERQHTAERRIAFAKGCLAGVVLGVAVMLAGGCSFPSEGEGAASSSSDAELPPRWPLPDAASSSSSASTSPASSSSSSSAGSAEGGGTSSSAGEDSTAAASSSEDDGGSSSTDDGTSSSSSTGDTCDHDLCEPGGALELGCSACVDDVCGADQYCCARGWDAECITSVTAICGIECH